jgi:HAD superfamily hydrolase (TIGR01509 family)
MIEAYFFDMDGTLVDSRAANRSAYAEAFARVGLAFDVNAYDATWGRDARDFLPDLAPDADASILRSVRVAKAEIYPTHLHQLVINDGLIALARSLAAHSTVGLVTTAKRSNVDAVLCAVGLTDMFDVVICGDDVEHSKPSPAPYLAAVDAVGVRPARALAFEDSEAGRRSAEAAGLAVVQVVFDA